MLVATIIWVQEIANIHSHLCNRGLSPLGSLLQVIRKDYLLASEQTFSHFPFLPLCFNFLLLCPSLSTRATIYVCPSLSFVHPHLYRFDTLYKFKLP